MSQEVRDILIGASAPAAAPEAAKPAVEKPAVNEAHENAEQQASDRVREPEAAAATEPSDEDRENQAGESQASQEQEAEATDKPVTLNELAEDIGVEAAELYDVEIKLPNDESVTLGAMKDAYKEFQSIKAERQEYETRTRAEQNKMMVERQQFDALLTAGIREGFVSEQTIQKVNLQHEANLKREASAIAEAIPEWRSDPAKRRDDFKGIYEMLEPYGFSEQEVLNIGQAKIIKFLYDQHKTFSAARFVKPEPKPVPRNTGQRRRAPAAKPNKLQQRIAAARANKGTDKQRLIADLITGKQQL